MKKLTALLLFFSAFYSNGQRNFDGLINAEKSFASYSVSHGTKDAFLKFLDSNGIVFEQGKAVNGIEIWNKREQRPGLLNWSPQYGEIASSNDFGYTTGPWELRNTTPGDSLLPGDSTPRSGMLMQTVNGNF